MGRIKASADVIKQVLTNLIKNSVEAMTGPGKIKIKTNYDILIGAKRYLEIVISDNGPGISPDAARCLFEQPMSTKGTGRGYGLIIVKNLLKEMGGLIHMKTRVGNGTSFQILIPLRKPS
jgi:C4-dicarboxylate-specific signal transduction histidine kinase